MTMDNGKTSASASTLERCVSDCEKTVIMHALKRAEGDAGVAAQMLGTTKRVLARKILKYEIDCTQFESR
jgi:Nif-specific regulatory protein